MLLLLAPASGMASYAQWLDPSDLSTLFQEITGASATTPSLVGDPVGTVVNKGTLGGYFVAPFTSWRPTLRQSGGAYYLEYDATINSPVLALQTTGTPKLLQLFAAARVTGQEAYGRVITAYDGDGADYASNTGWTFSRVGGSDEYGFYSNNTGPSNGAKVTVGQDTDFVIQTEARRDQNRARVNFGTAVSGTFGSNQTFPDLSYRYLGGETPISGRLYGAVGHLGTSVIPFDGSESDGAQLFQASSDTIQEWDNTVDATITEAQLAPDGTSTARLITETVGGYRHVIYEVDYNVMPANTVQTFTIYLKSNGRRYAQLLPAADGGGHWASVFVDLQDGVITDTDVIGGGANSEIIDTKVAQAGNGYWKVSLVFRLHAAAVVWHISLSDRPANTGLLDNQSPTYSGDGTSGIYMWRPKVVAGNVPAFNTPLALPNDAEDAIITYLQGKYAVATALIANSISSASSTTAVLIGAESDGTQLFKAAVDTIEEWNDTVFGSITDGHLAPDGTSTASLFTESGDNRHLVYADDNLAVAANTQCTFSVYLKQNGRRYAQLLLASDFGTHKASLFVDLQDGAITDSDIIGGGANSEIFASSVAKAGNGFWKVSFCFKLHAAPTVWHVAMSDRATLTGGLSLDSPAYVADGSSMYLWRPKVVAGNVPAVGPLTLTPGNVLTANSISSASSVGAPALTQLHALTASNISSASSVGTPALSTAGELTPNSISSATSVGTPALTQLHALAATNISSASSVGTPAVTQLHALTATSISSASSVGTPAVTQLHALTATSISSASSVGTPALSVAGQLVPNSISSASSVGTPAITQLHTLTANSVSSASSVGTPAVTQLHALTANSISSASFVGTPTLTLSGQIVPNSISSATSVGTPALGQLHALTASNILSASSVGTPGTGGAEDAALGGTLIKRRRPRPRARMPDTSSVETTEELEELRDLEEATTEAIGYLSLPKPERPPRTLTAAISSLAMELALPVIDLSDVSMQLAELDQMRTQLRALNRQIAERIALEEFLRAEAQDEEDALALLLA